MTTSSSKPIVNLDPPDTDAVIGYDIIACLLTGHRSQWERFGKLTANSFDLPKIAALFTPIADVYKRRDKAGWGLGPDGVALPIAFDDFTDELLMAGVIGSDVMEINYRREAVKVMQVSVAFLRDLFEGLTFETFSGLDLGRDLFLCLPNANMPTMAYRQIKQRMVAAGYEDRAVVEMLRDWRASGIAESWIEDGVSYWRLAPVNGEGGRKA